MTFKVANLAEEASGLSQRLLASEVAFCAPGLKRYETSEFQPRHPEGFVALSITGTACALQCDHCRGRLLEYMRPIVAPGQLFEVGQYLAKGGTRGVLVSGGSDGRGRVPLLSFVDELRRFKEDLHLRVLVHTGLVDEALAKALAVAGIDGAMIDIIGAQETVNQVYHLETSVEAYEASLANLTEVGVPTMPHIVLGLHYGRLLGEEKALEMVARYPVAALVLVVLTPLEGTPMEKVIPPASEEVAPLFRRARRLLPDTPILLGCARPAGEMRQALDRLAIDAGLNGIAYPAEGTVAYARSRGLRPRFYETCCSLIACSKMGV